MFDENCSGSPSQRSWQNENVGSYWRSLNNFNSFYQNVSILGEEDQDKKIFRVQLAKKVANTIKSAFSLLGIRVPERM